MASEDYKNIAFQPGPTCPMVDSCVSAIDQCREYLRRQEYDKIESELDDAENNAEQARDNAANIREWGQGWKDYAKELEQALESLAEDARTAIR